MEVLSKTLGFWDQVSSYTSRAGIREYTRPALLAAQMPDF